jgi:TolB protein
VPAMPSTSGDAAIGRQIAEIISSDLRITGLFTPLGPGGIGGYSYAEA